MSASRLLPGAQRDRRALAIGAMTILAMMTVARGIPKLAAWRAAELQNAEMVVLQAMVSRRTTRHIRQRQDSLIARRARLTAMDSAAVSADSPAAAAASLAELLSLDAQASKAQLEAVEPEEVRDASNADSAGGEFVPIAARASMTGDLDAIAILIANLETDPALLSIRELSISGGAQNGPGAAQPLRAEFVVEALAQVQRPPGARP